MQYVSIHMRLLEPIMKIWMTIDPYYEQCRRCPITVVSGSIRPKTPIFRDFRRYVFGTIGNEANIIIQHYLVPWPFYAKFLLLWTVLLEIIFTYFTVELVFITWPVETCGSGPWSAEYLGSAEVLRIFHRCYIVGTFINKANIST